MCAQEHGSNKEHESLLLGPDVEHGEQVARPTPSYSSLRRSSRPHDLSLVWGADQRARPDFHRRDLRRHDPPLAATLEAYP